MNKKDFYDLGRRDEIASFCMLIRAGGVKYAIESATKFYDGTFDKENPHIKYIKENIDKLKP